MPVVTEDDVRRAADIVALRMAAKVIARRYPRKRRGWFSVTRSQEVYEFLLAEIKRIESEP